jgi:DNA polymerase-4
MILHLDMDAFFASVEVRDNPALKGLPLVVGGSLQRGVVMAASYEARRFGIHSAMPMFKALAKCTDLVVVPPRRDRYLAVSQQVMSILKRFSPQVQAVSIDEARMDIAGCQVLFGSPTAIGLAVKSKIAATLEMTGSVGIAPGMTFAKIASDMHKPDGLTIIAPEQMAAFITRLPLAKIPGVGKVMQQRLARLDCHRLGDVAQWSEAQLIHHVGRFGRKLHALSQGMDDNEIPAQAAAKSISAEETLSSDTRDPALIRGYMLKHAERISRQLRAKGLRAQVVSIKLKDADFKVITRQTLLATASDATKIIYQAAVALLAKHRIVKPIRLIGVGTTGLMPPQPARQAQLFEETAGSADGAWRQIEQTVDEIALKFGRHTITRAAVKSTLPRDKTPQKSPCDDR